MTLYAGTDLLHLARQHVGEQYVFGARAPKPQPDYHGPWDCAELVAWCVYQATGLLYGCRPDATHSGSPHDPRHANAYTGYFAIDVGERGIAISVDEAALLPGAIVLRKPSSGRTGHIVFSDGQWGTVEAHSATHGVIAHTLRGRRWDTGILLPGVAYMRREIPRGADALTVYRVTEPMMRGDTVRAIQRALVERTYTLEVDGIYGPRTAEEVAHFQRRRGLVVDGEVGPETAAALGVEL